MDLAEALAALEGRKEFAVRRNDGLVTINYVVQMPGTFDGIRRDFRGITFDEATGECVARPLHKFFNVGQTEDTMFNRLKDRRATIYEKLDGSMVQWLIHRGGLRAATRMGPGTVQAEAAHALAEKSGLLSTIRSEVLSGWTPILEFCSPRFPIVVRYPKDRLVYLCSRNRETGAYRFDEPYPDRAERYTFPFSEIMADLNTRQDFEGFVCWLDNGLTVKAKCDWYRERHRAFDMMLRPAYKLYGLVFEGVMDDLIATAQPHHRPTLERVYREAQEDYLAERGRLVALFDDIKTCGTAADDPRAIRKALVMAAREKSPGDLGGLMHLFDDRSPDEVIHRNLMAGYRAKYPDPVIVGMEGEAG